MKEEKQKLGIFGLLAIVFGSMVGGGIFNIAQNMGASASVGATIIAWVVTLAGITLLTVSFKILADRRKDLRAGIYQYAKVGFGNYVGFNAAWGYWLSAAFGNVAYVMMLNDSLGVFFPALMEHQVPTAIFGTALVWTMFFIVSRGFNTAAFINTSITVLKFTTLAAIVILLIFVFDSGLAWTDIWGEGTTLPSVADQVRDTMMVTLWCFVGIEGAAMMNARAKRQSDVGKAGIIGLVCAWLLYLLVSVLSYGALSQSELAELDNPSLAYLLKDAVGAWAYYYVIFSVIISISGCWISWTLICAQVPYEAARVKLMPERFMYLNRHGMPTYCLLVTSIIVQTLVLLVITADSVYLAAISMASMMILPSYLLTGAFLTKVSLNPEKYLKHKNINRVKYFVIGIVSTTFCLWMVYAGGLQLFMLSSILYLCGTYFYIQAKSHHRRFNPVKFYRYFSRKEKCAFVALCLVSLISVIYYLTEISGI